MDSSPPTPTPDRAGGRVADRPAQYDPAHLRQQAPRAAPLRAWPIPRGQAAQWALRALRVLSVLTLATAVGVTLLGVPARLEELLRVSGYYTHLRVAPPAVAAITLAVEVLMALVFFACAALLLRRQPRRPMALLLALTLAAIGAVETGMSNALIRPEQTLGLPLLHGPVWALRGLEMAGLLVLLYVFPSGRFVPAWTRVLAAVWVLYIAVCTLVPTTPFNPLDGPTWRATPYASLFFGAAWFGTGILAQWVRLRRSAGVVERQQLKWTAVGLALGVVGMTAYYGTLAWGQSPGWPAPLPPDVGHTAYVLLRPIILALALGVFPVCLSIAVLQYRLFDIDLFLNRALVWTALTALTIGLYALIVGGLSLLLRGGSSAVAFFLAAGVIAVVFQPFRQRLQQGVNRLMYGERDDPYAALTRLGQRLGGALAPAAVAPAIVESIAAALKLPYVALAVPRREPGLQAEAAGGPHAPADGPAAAPWAAAARTSAPPAGATPAGATPAGATPAGATPAGETAPGATPAGAPPAGATSAGTPPAGTPPAGATPEGTPPAGAIPEGATPAGETLAAAGVPPPSALVAIPLRHHGQTVGMLWLAPRAPGEPFAAADRRLLDGLAQQAGVALYAAQQAWQAQRLAEDLQRSRERLVTAREEERRRLRRDLHDGLGPALASLTLKVDAAHEELQYDAAAAGTMLDGIKGDLQAALVDIRRLVYALRPPALDDLGLAASLRLLAERYQGANLAITYAVPPELPPLPAAVEVAAYRICAEALTNVVRHASARTCCVTLAVGARLELEIRDDGCGIPAGTPAGVGLLSMRERAAELGGTCEIAGAPDTGTAVRVVLPL